MLAIRDVKKNSKSKRDPATKRCEDEAASEGDPSDHLSPPMDGVRLASLLLKHVIPSVCQNILIFEKAQRKKIKLLYLIV